MKSELKKFLGKTYGRENPRVIDLAAKLGISVHMVQSVASGRRNFRDKAAARAAIAELRRDYARAR